MHAKRHKAALRLGQWQFCCRPSGRSGTGLRLFIQIRAGFGRTVW